MTIPIWFYVASFSMSLIGLILSIVGLKKMSSSSPPLVVQDDSLLQMVKETRVDIGEVKALQAKVGFENSRADSALLKSIQELPTRTLNTIQGSANTTTGKLGELIQFIELQRAYDRIFPVGDIVDFICIRFPNGEDKGAIEFVDVKTGDKAVLNSDQKKLRAMINDSKETIAFKVVKVDIT